MLMKFFNDEYFFINHHHVLKIIAYIHFFIITISFSEAAAQSVLSVEQITEKRS